MDFSWSLVPAGQARRELLRDSSEIADGIRTVSVIRRSYDSSHLKAERTQFTGVSRRAEKADLRDATTGCSGLRSTMLDLISMSGVSAAARLFLLV